MTVSSHCYEGGRADMAKMPLARHDLLPGGTLRLRSDNPWLSAALQLLQRDVIQRGTLSPASD